MTGATRLHDPPAPREIRAQEAPFAGCEAAGNQGQELLIAGSGHPQVEPLIALFIDQFRLLTQPQTIELVCSVWLTGSSVV